MNFLGHAAVSLATGHDDPREVLGVMLPDLATMAGVHLEPAALPVEVAAGVRAHHRADAAFHAQGTFLRGAADVRRELEALGLGPGPSRAVGHVGWELLLDGTLLGGPADAAYRVAWRGAGAADVVAGIRAADRARWAAFLSRWWPDAVSAYADPAAVGERLWHILGRRPRLRFDEADTPSVVAVLRAHVAPITAASPGLVAATADAVRAA